MSAVPALELNDGRSIPQLGFGVFQIAPEDTAEAVARALEVGYRHVDTAQMYGNEKEVGEAVRASGIDRADVFVTSKLSNSFHRPDDARRAFARTLDELGFDYVDLFLIHWPCRRSTTATSSRPGARSRSSSATAARGRSGSRTSRPTISSGSPPRPRSSRP